MTFRTRNFGLIIGGLTAVAVVAAPLAMAQKASSHGDPKLLAAAKITPEAAKDIATRARAGTVADWEIEKEAGGSGVRYSFDIKNHGKTYEVGVDAANGRVLENGAESAAKEAQEAKDEAKEDRGQ